MKVWQPGGHLMQQRGAKVEDWSWRRTVRRMSTLARLAAPYKRQTALALVSLLAATATALAPPYLAKLAIDEGITPGDLAALDWIVAAFVASALLYWGATYLQTYLTGWVGQRVPQDLRLRILAHLQRQSIGFFSRRKTGVLISRMTNDIQALDQLVTDGIVTLFSSTLTLVGTVLIMLALDVSLALITFVVAFPLLAVGSAVFRYFAAVAYRRVLPRTISFRHCRPRLLSHTRLWPSIRLKKVSPWKSADRDMPKRRKFGPHDFSTTLTTTPV